MPVAPSVPRPSPRRRAVPTALSLILAGAVLVASAGCGSLAQAEQPVGRSDLVTDLAARLTAAGSLTYSADYQLSGGRSASIAQAQKPARTAYTYPGGKLIVTGDATTECRTEGVATNCARTAPPAPGDAPDARLFETRGPLGLVPPATVIGLLGATALDPDAVVRQKDTTVAGEHATCVIVEGVNNTATPNFTVCVTTTGALGSFSTADNPRSVEMTMTAYRATVPPDAFAVPPAATVVDRRATGR